MSISVNSIIMTLIKRIEDNNSHSGNKAVKRKLPSHLHDGEHIKKTKQNNQGTPTTAMFPRLTEHRPCAGQIPAWGGARRPTKGCVRHTPTVTKLCGKLRS